MLDKDKIDQFIKKAQESKQNQLDLSSDEDLSIAIMNLVSIEEHFFFTAEKTGKTEYFDLLKEAREMRKELLGKIIKEYEGEVWCLPPKTVVLCNPEPKTIDTLVAGEKVLAHNGEFSPVRRSFVRDYDGDFVAIYPYYSDELLITPGHSVLCAVGVRKKQKDSWRKNFVEPKIVWKKAEEIEPTDFLLFPRYKDIKDIDEMELEYTWENKGCFKPMTFTHKRKIKIDVDLMKLIGLYISEGSINERNYFYKGHPKTTRTLYFSFGKMEMDLIKEARLLFQSVFGEELKTSETHTTTDLVCSKRVIVKFFKQFGKRSSEKELPMWVLQLPSRKLYGLIWGLVKGDGSESKHAIKYFTISEKLAYQLRILFFKLGILHSLKRRANKGGEIDGRKIKSNYDGFHIAFSGDAARLLNQETDLQYNNKRTSGNFGYVLDDYVMIPIRKIGKVKYCGKVFNIQTEAETYTTFAGVVHNCISKHLLAASMRLMEVGTKALGQGKKAEAEDLFAKSFQLYSLFWGVAKKLISVDEVKKIDDGALNVHDKEKKTIWGKLGELVKKAIDCCKE